MPLASIGTYIFFYGLIAIFCVAVLVIAGIGRLLSKPIKPDAEGHRADPNARWRKPLPPGSYYH
jgi:hypothetical protein